MNDILMVIDSNGAIITTEKIPNVHLIEWIQNILLIIDSYVVIHGL